MIKTLIAKDSGQVRIIKVEKIGKKYIYGRSLFKFFKIFPNDEGFLSEAYQTTKYDKDRYTILEGERNDLMQAWQQYVKEERDWHKTYKQKGDELKNDASRWVGEELKKWLKENSYPTRPIVKEER